MKVFLGETVVNQADVPEFCDYKPADWAMYFIEHYGQFESARHKAWALDQVARILNGCAIKITKATWTDGDFEYRVSVGEPSERYNKWVALMRVGEDGPETYGYDMGRAP